MKKILSIVAAAVAAVAFAEGGEQPVQPEVRTPQTYGILRVDIPVGQTNTVISVPWAGCGKTNDHAVLVKDLIRTTNLSNGDMMFVFDTTDRTYTAAFELQNGEWVGAQIVEGGEPTPSTTEIERGQAIVLTLKVAPTAVKPVYLYGEYDATSQTVTITGGSVDTPAFTLVAPTKAASEGESVSLDQTWINAHFSEGFRSPSGDYVWVPGFGENSSGGTFNYVSNKGFGKGFGQDFKAAVVPVGQGFWYISRSGQDGTIDL